MGSLLAALDPDVAAPMAKSRKVHGRFVDLLTSIALFVQKDFSRPNKRDEKGTVEISGGRIEFTKNILEGELRP